jgi:hypothetical protein
MENILEKTFIYFTLSGLIDNCELSCLAYELYIESLQTNISLKTINYRMIREYHLRNFFSYVANISKYYTSKKNKLGKLRYEYLNKNIPLKNDSQIKDRSIRNSFEHFEERTDNYFDGLINNSTFELDITDIYTRKITKEDNQIICIEVEFYKTAVNITDIYNEIVNIKKIAFERISNFLDIDFIIKKRNEKARKYGLTETIVSIDKDGNKTYYF